MHYVNTKNLKFDRLKKKCYNVFHVIKSRGDNLKKRIMISLLCGIIICCTAAYTFATTGIVNTDTLRLRKSNSSDSAILTLLSGDDKVDIIKKTDDGWYLVQYNGFKGYVSEQYITVNDQKETIQSEEKETSNEEENIETESSQEVNGTEEEKIEVENTNKKIICEGECLYTVPLINDMTLNVIEKDTEVEVLTEVNGWSYIKAEEFEGWIRSEKLKNKDAEDKIQYVNSSSVNFRKTPNTNGEVISKLTINKEVVVLQETNGWTKIKANDQIGYISSEFLSNEKTAVTTRSSSYRKKTTTTPKVENTQTNNNNSQEKVEETTYAPAGSNPNSSSIVEFAKSFVGCRYVHGGTTPNGFDCSGFTQYVYAHFGYSLSRTSGSQAGNGVGVNKSDLEPGDIICFARTRNSKKIGHVGIYIGGGRFVHAANSRRGVITSNVDGDGFYYVCARRIK